MLVRIVAVMTPTPRHQTPQDLDDLAWRIATFGIESFEDEIAIVARRALEFGADPVLAGALIDRTTPTVARERAFGRLVAAFRNTPARVLVAA